MVSGLDFSELFDVFHRYTRRAPLAPLLTYVLTESRSVRVAIPPAALHEAVAFLENHARKITSLGAGMAVGDLVARCKAYRQALNKGDPTVLAERADEILQEISLVDPTTRRRFIDEPAGEFISLLATKRFDSVKDRLAEAEEAKIYEIVWIQKAFEDVYAALYHSRGRETADYADARNLTDTLALNEAGKEAGEYYTLVTRSLVLRVCDSVPWGSDQSPVSRSSQYLYYLSKYRDGAISREQIIRSQEEHVALLVEMGRVLLVGGGVDEAEREMDRVVHGFRLVDRETVDFSWNGFQPIEGARVFTKDELERLLYILGDEKRFREHVSGAHVTLVEWASKMYRVTEEFLGVFDEDERHPAHRCFRNWVKEVAESRPGVS